MRRYRVAASFCLLIWMSPFYRLPAPNHRLLVSNHCLLVPNHSLAAPNEKQISWAPFGSPSFIAVPLAFCVQSLCRKGAGQACRRLLLKRSRWHKAGEPYKMADWWVVSRLSFFFYLLLVACRSVFYVSCMIFAFYVFSLTQFIRAFVGTSSPRGLHSLIFLNERCAWVAVYSERKAMKAWSMPL